MTKYGLHGALKAKDGNTDYLAQILLKAAEMMSQAKGCHLYIISKDPIENNLLWVTEVWESKEAHDQSLHIEGVRELISKAMPLLDGNPVKGHQFNILGGYGVE